MPAPPGEVVQTITVHLDDVDKMGVARQGNYLGWFRQGLEAFLAARGWSRELAQELGVRLAEAESYLRLWDAASCDEVLEILVHPGTVESHQFTMGYKVIRPSDGSCVASGYTVQECLTDRDKGRRLPAPLLAAVG